MKTSDIVRFRATHWLGGAGLPENERPWLIGLLIEYQVWDRIATVMYKDELIRIPARNVEKAGKKDGLILDNCAKIP
jgi:hypothetical protein